MLQVLKDPKEIQDLKDHKVIKVQLVNKDHKDQ